MRSSTKILLSPLFLGSLAILLINDFFLKGYFHNFLTGKLSDFAGLLVFALFWTAFFPNRKTLIFSSIIVLFTFWKSPSSDGFIALWNSSAPFAIQRVIDYTDLSAFVVLPLAWAYGENRKTLALPKFSNDFTLAAIALISVFAFTATSQPPPESSRYEQYDESYAVKKSPLEILKKLQEFETDEFSESKSRRRGNISVGLNLSENFCDNKPYASFELSDTNSGSEIKLNGISYQCETKTSDHRDQLKTRFENEIIVFLKK